MAYDRPRDTRGGTRRGTSRTRRTAAALCLLAPVVALLWVPWYVGERPELLGVPFFYWYQFAWVPGCSVALLAAHLLLRPTRRARARPPYG